MLLCIFFDKHYPSNREKFIKISLFCKSRFAKLYKIRAKSIRITLNKFPPIISKFIAKPRLKFNSCGNTSKMKELMEYMAWHHDALLKTMTYEQKKIF